VQPGCEIPKKALGSSLEQNQQETIDIAKRMLTGHYKNDKSCNVLHPLFKTVKAIVE
jgi:hypothetical protein